MAKFCSECGTAIESGAKFCGECGAALAAAPAEAAADDSYVASPQPVIGTGEPGYFDEPVANPPRKLLIAGGVAVAVALTAAAAYYFSSVPEPDKELETPQPKTVQAEDPDAPRPQEWFDSYADKYVSAELTRLTLDSAAKRNFPTARGSEVLEQIAVGTPVSGRWVEGADPETRWLKTSDGGYIWEGNLGAVETITPAGMLGLKAGASFPTLRGKIDPEGHYGSQMDDWETESCETYSTLDGQADVMVESGKATAFTTDNPKLATAKGIRVGSTEADLKKAYGSKLDVRENPYDGQDYFLWQGKERGIKFHVSSGRVDFISSGTRSIEYVEGCL